MSQQPAIRVFIADDHAVVRAGLAVLLNNDPEFTVVGEAGDGEEAVRMVKQLQPDLLLLDLSMPHASGLEVLRELAVGPSSRLRVILLTAAIDRRKILSALQLGVRGVVLKESAAQLLFQAVRAVMGGQYWVGRGTVADLVAALQEHAAPAPRVASSRWGVTAREQQILGYVAAGRTNKEVAEQLAISEDTVKHHVSSLFFKLKVSNRSELAVFALTNDLVAN